jgi:hypothetical protein
VSLGASIGTSLLNTLFATAVASYVAAHGAASIGSGLAHGYDTAFWWTCGIAAGGAIVAALLLRPGPLAPLSPVTSMGGQPAAKSEATVDH